MLGGVAEAVVSCPALGLKSVTKSCASCVVNFSRPACAAEYA